MVRLIHPSSLFVVGLFLLICPVFNFLPAYNEFKFIGVPVLALFGWWKFRFKLIKMDYAWVIFILFALLSISQVKIISLFWQPLFSWISIILLTIIARDFFQRHPSILLPLFQVSFLGMLLLIGIGTLKGIRGNQAWVDWCSQNVNHASVIPIVLSPTFIFASFRWKWVKFFHPFLIGLLWYFTFYFRSGLGIGLIGLITVFYLIRLLQGYWHHQLLRWGLAVIVLLGLVLVSHQLTDKIPQFSSGNSVRWQNYHLSWMAFLDQPLIGNGIGNWYFFMREYIPLLEEPYAHGSPMFSHSFVGRLLSEIGIIGFVAFFAPIFVGLYKQWKVKALLQPIPLLIIILMGTFFTFRPAESNEQTYNEIPLWLFLAVAQLQRKEEIIQEGIKLLSRGSWILLSLAILWSSYWFYSNHQYLRSIQYRKQRAFEKEHQILSRLYHPIFRTIVGSDLFAVEALINRAKKRMPIVIKKEALIILETPIKKETKVISQEGVVLRPGFSVAKGQIFSATVED